jgi:serralysin
MAQIHGTNGNDTRFGTSTSDDFYLYNGNDIAYGYDGNDGFIGGQGSDTFYGGNGSDIAYYYTNTTGVNVRLYLNNAWDGGAWDYLYDVERAYGSNYSDTLEGSSGVNALVGGGGDDRLYGLDGNDALFGHAGNDAAHGGTGNDILHGDAGNDRIYGDSGSDSLHGDDGNDDLHGGRDNDVLSGGAGYDSIEGDAGSDIFAFESAANANGDRIKDFRRSESDKIDLSLIDAKESPGNAGNQAFTWIGTSAFSGEGQLRYYQSDLSTYITYIQGSTDSDAAAEFTIQTTGHTIFSEYDLIL